MPLAFCFQAVEEYGSKTLGVHVLTVSDYLGMFWPDLTGALDIYESLKVTLSEAAAAEGQSKGKLLLMIKCTYQFIYLWTNN